MLSKNPHNLHSMPSPQTPQLRTTYLTSSPQLHNYDQLPQPLRHKFHNASLTPIPPQLPSTPWTLTTVCVDADGMKSQGVWACNSKCKRALGVIQGRAGSSGVSPNNHARVESNARSGPESAPEDHCPKIMELRCVARLEGN